MSPEEAISRGGSRKAPGSVAPPMRRSVPLVEAAVLVRVVARLKALHLLRLRALQQQPGVEAVVAALVF